MEKRKNLSHITAAVCVIAMIFALIEILVFTYKSGSSNEVEARDAQTLGSKDRYTYLILGKDRVSGLTDVMLLASVDTKGKSAGVVQIPRDTYVCYSENGYRKFNGALSVLGGEGLCEFIEENMGVSTDGYFIFDLDAFSKTVDAIGGVEIDLPYDIDYKDEYQKLDISFNAGKQRLDGEAAEKFVRYRSGYLRGDIGRIDAQKLFMAAFIREVKSSLSPVSALKLVKSVWGEIETNVPLSELASLAFCCFDIAQENIDMVTLAGQDIRSAVSGAWFYVLSKSSSERILRDTLGAGASVREFDGNEVFRNASSAEFDRIYLSDMPYEVRNSKDISENGIEIQKQ